MRHPKDYAPKGYFDTEEKKAEQRAERERIALRDWFAGQALIGLISVTYDKLHLARKDPMITKTESLAYEAYHIADFMIAQRGEQS
jgi:hypothetical protein